MAKLVCGVGVNDAKYKVNKYQMVNGKQVSVWVCPFYHRWKSMLRRCYSDSCHKVQPTYKGCEVCDDWLVFSNFKRWMENQDWSGKQLDKDLLIPGNKIYSPDACVFVSKQLNMFTTDSAASRGDYPIGVFFNGREEKIQSQCRNPFTGKQENLGFFDCEIKAHKEWLKRKHQLACELAKHQSDERLSLALMSRYAKSD
ncbi:HNH endonuclease [Vibrio phage K63]|nr:AP2 domain-containing protein [Vibrio phage 14E30.2]